MNVYSLEELIDTLKKDGLEAFGLYYSVYAGTCIANDDPENVGRIKIKCPAAYGDDPWNDYVFPRGMIAGNKSGVLWLPQVGDPIRVTFEAGNPRFPLWEYGWWLKGQTIEGHSTKKYLFVTPYGHRIEMNDEDKYIEIKHKEGFYAKIYEDGIFLGKGEDNLGKRIDDLFNLFAQTTVATPAGPSPFNNAVDYAALRNTFTQLLKSS